MALAISSSSTVTISSTYLRTISKVSSPGRFTAMPSAMVVAAASSTTCPASSDAFMLRERRRLHADHLDARVASP